MKKIVLYITIVLTGLATCAQNEEPLLDRNPEIYYHIVSDTSGIYGYEFLLLFPDSTFYIEVGSLMRRERYSLGIFTGHGDSLYLTSYQRLDTLEIISVDESRNPDSDFSSVVVVDEKGDTLFPLLIINDSSDLLYTKHPVFPLIQGSSDLLYPKDMEHPQNWVIKYDGVVKIIKVKVGDIERLVRYTPKNPENNVFHIKVNAIERERDTMGNGHFIDHRLFIKDGNALIDTYYEGIGFTERLERQTAIPDGIRLFPYRKEDYKKYDDLFDEMTE